MQGALRVFCKVGTRDLHPNYDIPFYPSARSASPRLRENLFKIFRLIQYRARGYQLFTTVGIGVLIEIVDE